MFIVCYTQIFPLQKCSKKKFNKLCLLWNKKQNNKSHPVYFQKNSAAPFGNRSPQLRGAWVCSWAELQNLQGGAAPPQKTETRWTEREEFLCLSDPLVKAPHFCRLLCWMGVARYSRNYTGWSLKSIPQKLLRFLWCCIPVLKTIKCFKEWGR